MVGNNIEKKVEELLESIIINLGYELYDVIYAKEGKDYYLRIVIDKQDGISIEDCENVNNAINDVLDEADYIKEQYYLEVSSPGVERVLRKEKHYISQIGKEIYVKLFKPLDKQKELIGILEEYNNKEIKLRTDEKEIKIELKDIALAKTIFNW